MLQEIKLVALLAERPPNKHRLNNIKPRTTTVLQLKNNIFNVIDSLGGF